MLEVYRNEWTQLHINFFLKLADGLPSLSIWLILERRNKQVAFATTCLNLMHYLSVFEEGFKNS